MEAIAREQVAIMQTTDAHFVLLNFNVIFTYGSENYRDQTLHFQVNGFTIEKS